MGLTRPGVFRRIHKERMPSKSPQGWPIVIRVLLLADTHVGLDLPQHPRVHRRRRGHDFQANFERALAPALHGEVDFVVHGGDLFYRARLPPKIVELGLEPLLRVAERGVPVFLVPGNHERGRIPRHLWSAHPDLHIFEMPTTFTLRIRGHTVAISGFPFLRDGRDRFVENLASTCHNEAPADLRLLCTHLAFEGAQVGVQNYTFRSGPEVVRGRDIPSEFAAVLSGHIHRAQILRHDLEGAALGAPVIYPGSIERTSFAEREEAKGYFLLHFEPRPSGPGALTNLRFHPLPTRPMAEVSLGSGPTDRRSLLQEASRQLRGLAADSVVRVKWASSVSMSARLSACDLRALAPQEMNIEIAYAPSSRSPPNPGT
jgi:exonuclease SbcD